MLLLVSSLLHCINGSTFDAIDDNFIYVAVHDDDIDDDENNDGISDYEDNS